MSPPRPAAVLPCPAHAELSAQVQVLAVRLDGLGTRLGGIDGHLGRLADAVERLTEADRESSVELLAEARRDADLGARLARLEADLAHRNGRTPRGGSTRRTSLEPPPSKSEPPRWRKAVDEAGGWAIAAVAAAVAAAVGGAVLAGVQAAGCQPVQRAPAVAGAGAQDAGADAP